jgi:RNA polymerase sigma-70 factor (ECF subfamily)
MDDVIRKILEGDKEQFRIILREYNEELLRIAYHFVQNWDDAKDITQDTFIKVYHSLKGYNPERPFKPWIYRIHLNQCKSAYRRHKRHVAAHVPLDPSTKATQETREFADEEAIIMYHVQSLSPKQKSAFLLVEIEGYSSREAAEIVGCSDSTLRVHLARAKQSLRKKLEDSGIRHE